MLNIRKNDKIGLLIASHDAAIYRQVAIDDDSEDAMAYANNDKRGILNEIRSDYSTKTVICFPCDCRFCYVDSEQCIILHPIPFLFRFEDRIS